MRTVLIVGIMLFVGVLVHNRIEQSHADGFKLGMHYALKTSPPSEELEVTCAGLWVGEQNKKYWNKQNAR